MLQKIKQKIKSRLGVPQQSWSLNNLRANGFKPSVVYDIGAYTGQWTEEVMNTFPGASFYMFEGQESKRGPLDQLSSKHPGKVSYNIGLLGAEKGKKVVFNEYETASSVLDEHHPTEAHRVEAELDTLDSVIHDRQWPFADLIKLDTQGYELEILKGGSECLRHAEVVLMEVSFIDVYKNAPLARDVINFMAERSFVIYDICTIMRRPYDKALFQADMLFVRQGSILIASKQWR